MSDDIDIVEHDLLEHPTLRHVFPDLSVVKQEVDSESEEHSYRENGSGQEKRGQPSDEDLCCETAHEEEGGMSSVQHQQKDDNLLDYGTVDGQLEDLQTTGETHLEEEENQPPDGVTTPGETQLEDDAELSPSEQLTEEVPAQGAQLLEEKQAVEEKPDSTTDLVVEITDTSPSNSPLVTSSQSLPPSHEGSLKPECPLTGDKVDSDSNPDIPDTVEEGYKDDKVFDKVYKVSEGYSVAESKNSSEDYTDDEVNEDCTDDQVAEGYKDDKVNEAGEGYTLVASDYEEKCFQSYVALEHWGPFLENSKCYCAECEILFATENAIAAHNMTDHSHLTEVSAASTHDRSYGRIQDNTFACDMCPAKFTRAWNLTKHKKKFHRNSVQSSTLTVQNGVLQVGQIIMEKSQLMSKTAPESPSTSTDTPRSNVQTLGKFKPKAKTTPPVVTPNSDIKTISNESIAQPTHLCQLCNTSLPTKEDLIAHLYSHVSHKCNFCNALFTQKALLERHLWTHARSRHSSSSSTKEGGSSSSASVSPVKAARTSAIDSQAVSTANRSTRDSTANEETVGLSKKALLKCSFCSQCFINELVYIRHAAIVHRKVVSSIPESARVANGNTYCKPCRRRFLSVALYNRHMRVSHITYACMRCNMLVKGYTRLYIHKKRECTAPMGMKTAQSKNVMKIAQSKNVQKVGTKLAKRTNSDLRVQFFYKCTICNKSFGMYKQGYNHLRRVHPDSERLGVIVRDMQKIVLKKAPPKVTQAKPVRGDDLIGFVIKKKVEESFTQSKSQIATSSEMDNATMLNTVIRCPGCDTCFKKYGNIQEHLSNCTVRPDHFYRKCKICHMKFTNVPSTTAVHEFQHSNCDNLQVLDYDDYKSSLHKILYKCDKCEIYYTNLHSLLSHFSSKNQRYTDCEICGYRIVANRYTVHMKGHEKYNLSRKDYIIIRFSHFAPMRGVKRKLSPLRPHNVKRLAVRAKTSVVANNAIKHTLVQCEICKHHFPGGGIIKHKRLGITCKDKKFVVCQHCGLTFSQSSLYPHMRLHKEAGGQLTMHDFSIVSSNRKPIAMNLKTAMSKLHKCRCGLRAHQERYLCSRNECNEPGSKCEMCDITFINGTYLWHLKFHNRTPAQSDTNTTEEESAKDEVPQQRTDEKVNSTKKTIVKTYIRCGKCKLNLQREFLKRHKMQDCLQIKRVLCLECGLMFSTSSLIVHKIVHEQSRTPLTMGNFRILNLSDMKPVKKELCPFPRCNKCGLCVESTHSKHGKMKLCEKDTRITCQVCRMTFSANIYNLHLPYYGCDDANVTKIARTEEKGTTNKAVAKIEDEIDEGQIMKMMSKYNSMDQLWTELYQCDECNILVDSYDEIMKHCEEHRSAGFEVSAYMCHVCDLNFDSSSFKRHKEQHFSRPGLNRSNFEVIEFRPSHYRTVWWQFYKNAFTANRVTYKLKQEGPEQHTIYQCISCKSFCSDKVAAYEHTVQENYCRSIPTTCSTCGLNVHKKSVEAHENYHTLYPSLTARGFRIFWFCKIVENPTELKTQPAPVVSKRPDLYKCAACELHFMVKKTACMHYLQFHLQRAGWKCGTQTDCPECGLSFTRISLLKHLVSHHNNAHRQLTIETISNADERVVGELEIHALTDTQANTKREEIAQENKSVRSKSVANKKPVTLYKCTDCKLHFIVRGTLVKHIQGHRKSSTYRSVTCNYCNLPFSIRTFVKHRKMHHVQSDCKASDFRIVKLSPKCSPTERTNLNLYKCTYCGVHCLNTRGRDYHMRACSTYIRKLDLVKCKVCQLTILRQNMEAHKNCKLCTFDIQKFSPLKLSPPKGGSSLVRRDEKIAERRQHILYKCSVCNVHCLSDRTMKDHMSANDHNLPNLFQCSVCRISFKKYSFTKHTAYHHEQLNLKLEDFTVIDVHPNSQSGSTRKRRVLKIPKIRRRYKSIVNSKNVLYKCIACNACLLKRSTAACHITYKHKLLGDIKICDGCSLPFTKQSLGHHKKLHKNCEKYTFKIVDVRPGANINFCEKSAGIETTEASKGNTSEDANGAANNEQYENVEYLEENMDAIDAESVATKNSNCNFSSEESNSTNAEVKPSEEDQGSLMTVQLANKHICPKCQKVFSSDISKNLHMALDHMTDA